MRWCKLLKSFLWKSRTCSTSRINTMAAVGLMMQGVGTLSGRYWHYWNVLTFWPRRLHWWNMIAIVLICLIISITFKCGDQLFMIFVIFENFYIYIYIHEIVSYSTSLYMTQSLLFNGVKICASIVLFNSNHPSTPYAFNKYSLW